MNRAILLLLLPLVTFAVIIERDSLDNGMVILTVEAHRIPVVEMRAYVRAGSVYDSPGKEGLANIVSRMLLRGTKTRSEYAIVESIESVGGALTTFTSEDFAGLSGKVLSKDLRLLLDLLNDCLRNPSFDETEQERLKNEVISGIRAVADDPWELSKREFRKFIFAGHPLAHYPEGYDTTVAELDVADVRAFHDLYYKPNNIFLVFIGDFDKETLMAMLKARFNTWQRGELPKAEIPQPRALAKPVGRIVPMSISQSYIILGNFGPKYGADDWLPTRVMNYILGTSSLSRMYSTIRAEKGLAYVAWSHFVRFAHGGYLAAEMQTKKERTGEAVQTMLEVLRGVQDTIRPDELERARNFYTGYFPLTYDSYSELASLVAHVEFENLGLDYIDKFGPAIKQLNLSDLSGAARKYLHPDNFYLLIVGDVEPEDVTVEGIEWVE